MRHGSDWSSWYCVVSSVVMICHIRPRKVRRHTISRPLTNRYIRNMSQTWSVVYYVVFDNGLVVVMDDVIAMSCLTSRRDITDG